MNAPPRVGEMDRVVVRELRVDEALHRALTAHRRPEIPECRAFSFGENAALLDDLERGSERLAAPTRSAGVRIKKRHRRKRLSLKGDQFVERLGDAIHREQIVGAGHVDDEVVASIAEHLGLERRVVPRHRLRVERADAERVDDDSRRLALEGHAEEPNRRRAPRDHLQPMRSVVGRDVRDTHRMRLSAGLGATSRRTVDANLERASFGFREKEHVEEARARPDRRAERCGRDERRRSLPAILDGDASEPVEAVSSR